MVTLRCTIHPPMYSWYPPHASWYPSYCTSLDVLMISPYVLMVSPDVMTTSVALKTHYAGWLYCFQNDLQAQQEGEHPGKNYVAPDWLCTHCSLSQNPSLPCNTKFLIIPVNKLCTPLSSKLCSPAILKVNACCLTLAISYFILLFWPLFVPCLFEKFCWEGKRLAESIYSQNHWCAQFNCKKC